MHFIIGFAILCVIIAIPALRWAALYLILAAIIGIVIVSGIDRPLDNSTSSVTQTNIKFEQEECIKDLHMGASFGDTQAERDQWAECYGVPPNKEKFVLVTKSTTGEIKASPFTHKSGDGWIWVWILTPDNPNHSSHKFAANCQGLLKFGDKKYNWTQPKNVMPDSIGETLSNYVCSKPKDDH